MLLIILRFCDQYLYFELSLKKKISTFKKDKINFSTMSHQHQIDIKYRKKKLVQI